MSILPTSPASSANGSTDPKTSIPAPRKPGDIDDRGTGRAPQSTGLPYFAENGTDEQAMAFLNAIQQFIDAKTTTDPTQVAQLMIAGAKGLNEAIDQETDWRDALRVEFARIERRPFTDDYGTRLSRIDILESTPEQLIASVIASAQCPPWCDNCCPDDFGTSPIHSGLIATITDKVHSDVTTVEVRIERQDNEGVPHRAYVALKEIEKSSMLEFGTTAALALADAIGDATRAVLRDRANPEGGAR